GGAGAAGGQVGGGAGSGAAGAAGGGAGGAGAGGSPPSGLPDVGALVVLGDSIGDGGGQGPFYYELLKADLSAKYGNVKYVNNANGGSKTDDLAGQIKGLPGSLPGPVAVTVTSGGNDMKEALPLILAGADAMLRAKMGQNIDQALGLLLQPGRFGPGVAVYVFEANIYDASDGQGNFKSGGCAIKQNAPDPSKVDGYFAAWNGEIATRVSGRGQTLSDIHGLFYGHGFNGNDKWYASDCTHPNAKGHDQLRRLFYEQITGEKLP
ncbi:MAG: SGNH/GDSL hydrolase family protein, partial [Deltaproteobacteria bacterium]|nr:SGNH/GDSL hydrolase family protein [Deltaproteobacteria bacterium]